MTSRHAYGKMEVGFITNRGQEANYTNLFESLLRESDVSRWAVAFIRKTGVDRFADAMQEAHRNRARIRCLTAFDFHQTQPFALKELLNLGVEIKLAAPGWGTFHPKLYLFSKEEKHQAIIGSANLTGGAFEQNVETGIHIVGGSIIGEMSSFFADHWNDERTVKVTEELLKDKNALPDIWNEITHTKSSTSQTPLEIAKPQKAISILQRILSVTEVGQTYSIGQITTLVLERHPDWDFGLTPDASIRRDLNYASDRHLPLQQARFRAIRGKYQRLR